MFIISAYLELQKFEAYRFMTRNTSPLSHRSSREEVAAEEEQGKGKAQEVGETGSQVLAARSRVYVNPRVSRILSRPSNDFF